MRGENGTKGKGCDIGYARAARSCEGANSVEACTVTALDAITAFAAPNPNSSSQSSRFFQVWLPFGSPRWANHSAYFGPAKFYLSQPFRPSTQMKLNFCSICVNARFWCNRILFEERNLLNCEHLMNEARESSLFSTKLFTTARRLERALTEQRRKHGEEPKKNLDVANLRHA